MSDTSSMKTGRPTEFDRNTALERAMVLFWRQGYEATSLSDLLGEMGIGRQSLYNAFGDKQALFIEAARHYGDKYTHAEYPQDVCSHRRVCN